MITLKIKKSPKAKLPVYKSSGAAGADIFSLLDYPMKIEHGEISLIPTGISIEIPEGFEAQIRPRSGLALKYGITILNTPGTIDSDYRGEIKIILINLGKKPFTVENGMRIAQIMFTRVYKGEFIKVNELSITDRNDGGFGHTGK